MINRTEQEIVKNWPKKQGPVVSVCCTTYNQEKYISEAIDSFLMQETDFPFEVIIRDDFSTDKTKEIISGYVENYPQIIKPIYETENKYSKGVKPMFSVFKKAKGAYFALCEGDDYWTDSRKLQIQVDALVEREDVDICFHHATGLYRGKRGSVMAKRADIDKVISIREVILGDGDFIPTASLLLRREVIPTIPDWFYTVSPVGDYFLQIYGSLRGGAYYVNRNMSIYRINSPGGWVESNKNIGNRIKFTESFERSLKCFLNEHNAYSDEVRKVLSKHFLSLLLNKKLDIAIRKNVYKEYSEYLSFREKISWLFVSRYPLVHTTASKVTQMIRGSK